MLFVTKRKWARRIRNKERGPWENFQNFRIVCQNPGPCQKNLENLGSYLNVAVGPWWQNPQLLLHIGTKPPEKKEIINGMKNNQNT